MTVRAKFKCTAIEERAAKEGDEIIKDITLEAVINGSPENKEFFKWTPSGRLTLGCVNPSANAMFVEGDEYYLDITRATPTDPVIEQPAPVVDTSADTVVDTPVETAPAVEATEAPAVESPAEPVAEAAPEAPAEAAPAE